MEHPVCHEARIRVADAIIYTSISTSYARSESIDHRCTPVCDERNDRKFALVPIFFWKERLALNGTDLAKFEDRFWSWTCVHLSLTCVRVRKECSVGKTLLHVLPVIACSAPIVAETRHRYLSDLNRNCPCLTFSFRCPSSFSPIMINHLSQLHIHTVTPSVPGVPRPDGPAVRQSTPNLGSPNRDKYESWTSSCSARHEVESTLAAPSSRPQNYTTSQFVTRKTVPALPTSLLHHFARICIDVHVTSTSASRSSSCEIGTGETVFKIADHGNPRSMGWILLTVNSWDPGSIPGRDASSSLNLPVSSLAPDSNPSSVTEDSSQPKGCFTRCRTYSGMNTTTVRSGAEERPVSGARLDVLIFRLRSCHVLNHLYCRC